MKSGLANGNFRCHVFIGEMCKLTVVEKALSLY